MQHECFRLFSFHPLSHEIIILLNIFLKISQKLVQFWKHTGCHPIDITAKNIIQHHLVTRNIFFAQKRLENTLREGGKFYLFTGRGPSTQSMQFGHLVPFMLCRHLQQKYECPLVIQISDDEKYFCGRAHDYKGNLGEIELLGFIPELTEMIINSELPKPLLEASRLLQRHMTVKMIKRYLGFDDQVNIGSLAYPTVQIAPALPNYMSAVSDLIKSEYRCLVVAGVDQSPYFCLANDIWKQISDSLPLATIYNRFLPSLDGREKASSSVASSCIFLNDSPDVIRKKLRKAYSGGAAALEEHKKGGAVKLEQDVALSYLETFLEDEAEFQDIKQKYQSGLISSLQLKEKCADVLISLQQKIFYKNNIKLL